MKISISVPKPCHENWNAMTPATDARTGIGGRHCASCEHTVMDLTRTSDAQLIELFRKGAMPKCARFSQEQLDRVIAMEERSPRLLPAAAVGAALALSAPDASAQNCIPTAGKLRVEPVLVTKGEMVTRPVQPTFQVGQTLVPHPAPAMPIDTTDEVIQQIETGNVAVEEIQVITGDVDVVPISAHPNEDPGEIRGGRTEVTYYYIDGVKVPAGAGPGIPRSAIEAVPVITGVVPDDIATLGVLPSCTITGRVIDSNGEPIPFVNVILRGTSIGVAADAEGRYTITAANDVIDRDPILVISVLGYQSLELPISSRAVQAPADACVFNDRAPLTGRVTDSQGKPIPYGVVEVVEAGLRCPAD